VTAREGLPKADLLIRNAAQIVTCPAATPYRTAVVTGGSLAVVADRVAAVGDPDEVAHAVDCTQAATIDASGKVVAPGFVDCHTHLVFGGSRVAEYAARMTGADLSELRAAGVPVGPEATVQMTRSASFEELVAAAAGRLRRMLHAGSTTVESKSGYGLSTPFEVRLLEVNGVLDEMQPVDVVSTLLGAHGFPDDRSREQYLEELVGPMTMRVAEAGLAAFVDVWVDDGYYTKVEARRILRAGQAAGMQAKIHADAYSYVGGTDLGAEIGAVSVDHLNYTPRHVMRALAAADVVGVIMPALDFAVAHPRPFDARAMIEEGMTLALATDLCPGCWTESMQFVMALACRLSHMSPAEAMWAATAGGALALELGEDRGSLEVGKRADLQIWSVPRYEDVIYRLGGNVVETVVKSGRIVVGPAVEGEGGNA